MEDEEWSTADRVHAKRYFTARTQPPSARALDHYVIYMTARSTSSSLVVRLAVDPEAGRTSERFGHIGDISVVLPDGSTVGIDTSLCWRSGRADGFSRHPAYLGLRDDNDPTTWCAGVIDVVQVRGGWCGAHWTTPSV